MLQYYYYACNDFKVDTVLIKRNKIQLTQLKTAVKRRTKPSVPPVSGACNMLKTEINHCYIYVVHFQKIFSLFAKTSGYPVSRSNKSRLKSVLNSYDIEVHYSLRGSFFFVLICLQYCSINAMEKNIINISIVAYFFF